MAAIISWQFRGWPASLNTCAAATSRALNRLGCAGLLFPAVRFGLGLRCLRLQVCLRLHDCLGLQVCFRPGRALIRLGGACPFQTAFVFFLLAVVGSSCVNGLRTGRRVHRIARTGQHSYLAGRTQFKAVRQILKNCRRPQPLQASRRRPRAADNRGRSSPGSAPGNTEPARATTPAADTAPPDACGVASPAAAPTSPVLHAEAATQWSDVGKLALTQRRQEHAVQAVPRRPVTDKDTGQHAGRLDLFRQERRPFLPA